jgi:membrane protease YdiL (CAAX protease family)
VISISLTHKETPMTALPLTAAARTAAPMRRYLLLAFGLAWLCLGLAILSSHQLIPLPFAVYVTLGTLAPSIGAVAVTYGETGWSGVRSLLAQAARWRLAPGWYALVIFGSAGMVFAAYLLSQMLGGPRLAAPALSVWLSVPIMLGVLTIFGLTEEIGWRGFALPRLQAQHGALVAALAVGIIHGVWHLPVWFIAGGGYDNLPFPVFVLFAIGLSVVFAWLYNRTGSVLLTGLAHAAVNAFGSVWGGAAYALPPAARGANPVLYMSLVLAVMATGLVIGTQGRLGRNPED